MNRTSCTPHRQRGMGLMEIMIGMVIGMLTVLVIMHSMSVSEKYKRTTASGSDAQTNGAIALYLIERDLRMAGYGLTSDEIDGIMAVCSTGVVRAYNQNRTPTDFQFTANSFAPVVIDPANLPAGDAGSQVVLINYSGTFGMTGAGMPFQQQSGASANYKVDNRAGYSLGDLVLAVQPGQDCSVAEITGLPGSSQCSSPNGQSDVIIHNNGQYNNSYQNCTKIDSTWNKPGGLGVTYTSGKLYNLGPPDQIVAHAYAVRSGKLTMCNLLTSDCTNAAKVNDSTVWIQLADDVVGLRAQYGQDNGTGGTVDDGIVDSWDTTTPTTYAGWKRILAARVAVTARSKQYDKDVVTGSAPSWQGGSFTLSSNTDWQHYRYKTFETVTPLRNVIWSRP